MEDKLKNDSIEKKQIIFNNVNKKSLNTTSRDKDKSIIDKNNIKERSDIILKNVKILNSPYERLLKYLLNFEITKDSKDYLKIEIDLKMINNEILKIFSNYEIDESLVNLTFDWSKETFLCFSHFLIDMEFKFISEYSQVESFFNKESFEIFFEKYAIDHGIDKYELIIALMSLFYKNLDSFLKFSLILFCFEDKNEIYDSEFCLYISSLMQAFVKYFVIKNKCYLKSNIIEIKNEFDQINKSISASKEVEKIIVKNENDSKSNTLKNELPFHVSLNDIIPFLKESFNLINIIKKLLV